MEEKIEKAKMWFKENWMYVTAGAATAGVVALAIFKGLKTGDTLVDPITIDKADTIWMDQLKSGATCNGKELTVREALSVGRLDGYICKRMKDSGVLTPTMQCDITDDFIKQCPATTAVLDSIDGFWTFVSKSEVEEKEA